jgi:hypothetical protein
MKINVISLAIASCFVFGASLAQAQAITAPKPVMEYDKAESFSGKGLNTPWNCCKQYVGFDGSRDQPGEVNKPGAKINHSRNRDGKLDPGFKGDDGNRMPEFMRIASLSANNEPTDSKAYGAGKDAATTGNAQGSGDTLGQSHFSANSGYKQWVNK